MTTPLRIGIAGAHFGAQLARGFAQRPDAALVAVADPDPERRGALAAEFEIDDAYEDAIEMMQAAALDAVIVATPTYLHERHLGAAFDAGLHALCASPVGVRGSEISHIVTSAGLVGKTFMGSNPLRYDPRIADGRALVDSGALGNVHHAYGSIHLSQWPHPADSWRLERDLGGGALMEVGAPSLDALWYAMGAPDPMEAMAARFDSFSSQHARELDHPAEDTLCGMVRFKDGACLQFTAQLKSSDAAQDPWRQLRLNGSSGSLDLERGARFASDSPGVPQPYAEATAEPERHAAEAAAFLEAVASDSDASASGKQALAFHKMIDALLRSAREKEAVSIKVERSLEDLLGGL